MKIMVRQPGATIGYIIDADDQRPEFEQAKKAFLLRLHGERVDLEVKLLAVQRLIAKVENMEKPE